jgi:hypothetical protein
MSQIKEKTFLALKADVKNKNHRTFTSSLCKSWCESPRFEEGGGGFDIECAIDDNEYDYEHIKDELIVGRVVRAYMEGQNLMLVCQFKLEGDAPYLKEINNEEGFLDKCTVIPKGKGAVKNQLVQDDYELYGFNLIWAHESAFAEDTVEAKAN